MARLLAIEWDASEIRVAVARRRGSEADVEQAFAIELPARDPLIPDADVTVNQLLVRELAAHGLTGLETLVAVGRTSIELRVLNIPPAPPEELPDMVRFQAIKQFAALGDNWPLDFVPLDRDGEGAMNVLAATISPDMLGQIEQTCKSASVAVKRLVLRPFAAASLWRRRDTSSRCSMMVDVLADEADLTVLVDGHVGFLRTVRLPAGGEGEEYVRAMIGELRRTIAAAQNQLTGRRVERIVLCGDRTDHELLQVQIEQQLSLDIEFFEPFADLPLVGNVRSQRPKHPGRFAPLLGMLVDEAANAPHAIDFLHPRKRPEPVSFRRRNSLIAATAATVLLAGVGLVWLQLHNLNAKAERLRQEVVELDNTLKAKRPVVDEVEKIDAFTSGDITWLDELYTLSDRFLPAAQSLVTEITLQTLAGAGSRMHVEGYATEPGLIDQLERKLRDEQHGVSVQSSQEDLKQDIYRWKFDSEIAVEAKDPEERFVQSRGETAAETKPVSQTPVTKSLPAAGKQARGGEASGRSTK